MRLRAPAATALLVAGLLVGGSTTAVAAEPGDLRISAHRGAPREGVTENTVRAMRRAVRLKASAVETDVRMTADGRAVLMHDPTLQRTTTCRGRVAERTLRSLRSRCRGQRGGEQVPTLADGLRLAARSRINVLAELKGERWTRAEVAEVLRVVGAARMVGRVTLMSFHPRTLRRVEALQPEIRTTYLVRRWAPVAEVLTYADGVTLPPAQLTRAHVEAVRAAGKQVIARKANNPRKWRQLKRLEVGAAITDRVRSYRRWLRR